MSLLLYAAVAGYALALVRIFVGLGRLREGSAAARPSATVLVAARNEEKNIGGCLEALQAQDYGGEFEILVLDDGSTDKTAHVVGDAERLDPRIRLIPIPAATDDTAPKKHALLTGLAASHGEFVFVTDADCVVPAGWMSGLASHFEDGIGLVTGAVFLPDAAGLVGRMRNLDFAAYTFCSAGAMAAGWPLIATAMNLAYRREAFESAGGFGRDSHVLSGDDDLLLHTIVRETPWRAAFAYGPEVVVETKPVTTVSGFLNQRMRWASKAFRYPPGMTLFLIAAFLTYAGILVGLPLYAAGLWSSSAPLVAAGVKLVADALVVFRGSARFGLRGLRRAFLPAQILHLPYILAASIGGAMGLFRWKGRGA